METKLFGTALSTANTHQKEILRPKLILNGKLILGNEKQLRDVSIRGIRTMLACRSDFGKQKQPPYLKQKNKLKQFQVYLAVVFVSLNVIFEEIIYVSNIKF